MSQEETQQPQPKQPSKLHIRFLDSRLFKAILEALHEIRDEITFEAKPSGLTVSQVDPSHISAVVLDLPKELCEDYHLEPTESFYFSVNVEDLLKRAFRRVEKGEYVVLDVEGTDDGANARLELYNQYSRVTSFKTLSVDKGNIMPTPIVKHTVTVSMLSKTLKQVMEDASPYRDWIKFKSTNEGTELSNEGDSEKFSVTLDRQHETVISHQVNEEAEALYSINYLKAFIGALEKVSDAVTFSYSTTMPMYLYAEISRIKIGYWMAPRIEA